MAGAVAGHAGSKLLLVVLAPPACAALQPLLQDRTCLVRVALPRLESRPRKVELSRVHAETLGLHALESGTRLVWRCLPVDVTRRRATGQQHSLQQDAHSACYTQNANHPC
eukprot:942930-Pleurochrysis_carterae.AAC.2